MSITSGPLCENTHYTGCASSWCSLLVRCSDLILGTDCGQLVACDCPCTGGPA